MDTRGGVGRGRGAPVSRTRCGRRTSALPWAQTSVAAHGRGAESARLWLGWCSRAGRAAPGRSQPCSQPACLPCCQTCTCEQALQIPAMCHQGPREQALVNQHSIIIECMPHICKLSKSNYHACSARQTYQAWGNTCTVDASCKRR
jgi:hypothetical protein